MHPKFYSIMKKVILKNIANCVAVLMLVSCGGNRPASNEDGAKKDSAAANSPAQQMAKTEDNGKNQRTLEFVGYADSVNQGLIGKDTLKTSARREAVATIGNLGARVNYGSPGRRGRTIWNGLVAYDQVWVTGAHTATTVVFDKDILIAGQRIAAGTYGFFTVPTANEWILILNKNADQHLADDYTEKEDVVRVKVKPEILKQEVFRLTYDFVKKSDVEGALSMSWGKIKVSLTFQVAQ